MSLDYDAYADLPLRSSDSETLDWEEVKEEQAWEAPEDWWDSWGVGDMLYRVSVELPSESLSDEVWDSLTNEYSTEDDAVVCGGAVIEREDTVFHVSSSGEDGLDSLIFTVNDVLVAAVESAEEGADWVVTEAKRWTE